MTFSFRPGVREQVGLMIGLAGGTGSGKTMSALRLATGMAQGKKFCVIDTESRRALHYADAFKFDHGDLRPPFRPKAYADAIKAADDAGYPVIVVDSASHEHAGEGGLLDYHEAELDRMAGDDWKKRDACKMSAWIKPKTEHKAFVSRLLQLRAHLILCFRAEEKIEMVRGDDGKMKIQPKKSLTGKDGWIPICEKNLPYEMTASFLLLPDRPGIGHPIKLQEQHRPIFPVGEQIGEAAGSRLAEWARGASPAQVASPPAGARPAFTWINGRGKTEEFSDASAWENFVMSGIAKSSAAAIKAARERNGSILANLPDREAALRVSAAMNAKAEAA